MSKTVKSWTSEDQYEFRDEAISVLNEVKERRKGMLFKLVRYPFYPDTFIEIKIA
jgi:hypothetical protein